MSDSEEVKGEDTDSSSEDITTGAETTETSEGEETEVAGESEGSEGNAESVTDNEVAESDAEAKKDAGDNVIVYDFAHPSHKLNSRLPVLEVINSKIATNLATLLSAQFHQKIEIEHKEASFEKFENYVKTLPECISISQYRMDPLQGSSLLILDGDLIFMLVDSFFGGVDELSESLGARSFTPTELRITEKVRDNVFSAISSSWESVIRINPVFQTLLTNVELTNPSHPSAVVVCCKFDIKMKSGTRECHLVIPYSVLEPIRPQLTNDLQVMPDQDYAWLQEFTQQVMGCDIDIEGVFAESRISVKELVNLKVGDFIPLGKVQTVEFSSEGVPLFEASVGVSNGMVSASVNQWHERKKIHRR